MSANEFDELIRHKFDETDIAFNPGNWEKMSHQLNKVQPPHKNSFFLLGLPALSGIAAAIALLVALPILWLQNDNNGVNNIAANTEVHQPAPSQQQETTAPANMQDEPPTNANVPAVHIKQTRTATAPIVRTIITPQANENAQPHVAVNNTADNNSTPVTKQTTTLPKQQTLLAEPAFDAPKATVARTSINLIGGFNYNAASAGFMVGASANRNLNDKLYVEGNLAYVNSSVGGNSPFGRSSFEDQYDASPNVNGGQTKVSDPQPVQYSLSYLQFSPVMGYHISERFTVSAGPDLQQLLNTESYFITNLPSLDLGLLGKAEFGITEKLKAGLQYRAGVNNLVQNKNYTERNYMQVQIRYSIFNK